MPPASVCLAELKADLEPPTLMVDPTHDGGGGHGASVGHGGADDVENHDPW